MRHSSRRVFLLFISCMHFSSLKLILIPCCCRCFNPVFSAFGFIFRCWGFGRKKHPLSSCCTPTAHDAFILNYLLIRKCAVNLAASAKQRTQNDKYSGRLIHGSRFHLGIGNFFDARSDELWFCILSASPGCVHTIRHSYCHRHGIPWDWKIDIQAENHLHLSFNNYKSLRVCFCLHPFGRYDHNNRPLLSNHNSIHRLKR